MKFLHPPYQLLLIVFAFIAMTLVSFTSCSKSTDQQLALSENIIVPGVGVGYIQMGMTAAEIVENQGEGSAHAFKNDHDYTHSIRYSGLGMIVYFENSDIRERDDSLEVVRIELNSTFVGQTLEGIGIGSLNQKVREAYGRPNAMDYPIEKYDEGISYVYPYGNKVGRIVIEAAWRS